MKDRVKGSGRSGEIAVQPPSQKVILRSGIKIRDDSVTLILFAGLPGTGRSVIAKECIRLFSELLPSIWKETLTTVSIDSNQLEESIKTLEDYFALRENLDKNGSFTFDVDGNKISLDNDDFIVDFDIQEGFAYSKRNNLIGIISTTRNEELMAKGLVKDLARRLQSLRKERGYNPTDILSTASVLELDQESLDMLKDKTEELAFLVRVKQVNFTHTCKEYKDDDIDGQKIKISVE